MNLRTAIAGATTMMLAAGPALAQTPPSQSQSPAQTPPQQTAPPAAAEGVTVTGQRSTVRTSIDRLSYDVANDLQTQTGTVADALRNVPGVEVDAQGNISLRGDGNVTILIDGRPSAAFNGEGRADVLQQFPADRIARVEVITNPNAAMSPEGTAGIINLVTKRDSRAGSFGSLRANVGTEERWNVGVSGSRVGEKLTLSGDLGFRYPGTGENDGLTIRATRDAATGRFVEQRSINRSQGTGGGFVNARGALDYKLNPRDTVSAEVTHRGFEVETRGVTRFERDAAAGGLAFAERRLTDGGFKRGGTDARLSFVRQLGEETADLAAEDHRFSVDLQFDRRIGDRDSDLQFETTFPTTRPPARRTRNEETSDEISLEIAYARPLPGEAKLRVGFDAEQEKADFDRFSAFGPSFTALTPDPTVTNRFAYEEAVYATYLTYERPFGKVTLQGGLRFEQVETEFNQKTTGVRGTNDYFRAYPTLFATYDLSDTSNLRASYSRRIERPDEDDLNPFLEFQSPESVSQGNPNLDPEITDSFELGYQRRSGPSLFLATLFYRQSSDGVTQVVRQRPDGVFLTTSENLAESRSVGVELLLNGRLGQTMTYNIGSTLLWREIDSVSTGAAGSRSGTSIGGRFSLNWTPTANDFVQFGGFAIGEQLQAQGVREPSAIFNIGYRRKLNDRISLVLTGNNIFDTFRQETRLDTATLREQSEQVWQTPSAFVGFTLNFGQAPNTQRRRGEGFEFEGAGGPG